LYNDANRDNFIERLSDILTQTSTPCYGWALIANHFHLFLRSSKVLTTTVTQRLLTGYAVSFNHRHRRYGHLFQIRNPAISLCESGPGVWLAFGR
jgi:hypothetical protein